jgi:hypothetical protein
MEFDHQRGAVTDNDACNLESSCYSQQMRSSLSDSNLVYALEILGTMLQLWTFSLPIHEL